CLGRSKARAALDALAGLRRGVVAGSEVSAEDVLPAWVSLLTTGLLGFLPTCPRSCLENTDPRTRGRGIQLLSQVLLQCYSLLQEKEGKGCSGPLSGRWHVGGKACAAQVSFLQLVKGLI
uniref:Uncharacterized protein n=1 Tax=Otus sunia TaxID=257818 RepID=A0A8C8B9G2_9STRI